jgi:hypothetical protein
VTVDDQFLSILDDLETRAGLGQAQYEAYEMALPLRKLLLDKSPIVEPVNDVNTRKLTIEYRVAKITRPRTGNWSFGEAIHAEDPTVQESLSRDEFLKHVVMVHDGLEITVEDVIDFCAHHAGGVHYSKPHPKNKKQKALAEVDWTVQSTTPEGQYSGPTMALVGIARIVLDGLAPLRTVVKAETVPPGLERNVGRRRPRGGPSDLR